MARKKQEIALQQELNSTEEWDEALAKEGLWVIDVYQEWCGPCVAMAGNFRRIKNELGDDLLKFAVAKADTISPLEKYKGSCEPCFLFYAGGVLVAYVHSANAPLIMRTITEQLAQEHKVLDGSSERREVKDLLVTLAVDDKAVREGDEEEEDSSYVPHRRVSTYPGDYEEEEEGYTVAIIKPNVVKDGKVEEILEEMKAHGIKVLAQEERQLTEDEARQFYAHLQDQEYFEDLVKFMASGPSHVLVLTKGQADDSIIHDWRDMLGPPQVEEAKEVAPTSLRARYGAGAFMNAVHGSDSQETAARELAFFFPSLRVPTHKKQGLQRTLALIRPDAFAQNKDEILQKIKEAGFQIALQRIVQLTRQQAEEFYSEHVGQPYFEELTTRMSSGPLLALGLARTDAIDHWRSMLGPKDIEEAKTTAPDSLRAQYSVEGSPLNQLHGSDSPKSAKEELNFFFPIEQTVAVIKPDAYGTKDAIIQKIHEAGFRIAAHKETTITHDIAASFYEDAQDKSYYTDLVEYMTSGPTMFMVLSREGAVDGWRQEIGPTDPSIAKQEAPDSIRAQFGQDILHNAVHGCSTKEEAMTKIHKIFGLLEFNPDGTVKAPPAGDQQAEEEKKDEKQPDDEGQKQPDDEGQKQPGDEGQKQPDDEGQRQPGDEGQKQPGDEGQKQPDDEDQKQPGDEGQRQPGDEGQRQPGDEGQKQPGDEGQRQPDDEGQRQPDDEDQKQEDQPQGEEKPSDQQQEETKDEQGEQQEDQPLEETKLEESQQEDNGQVGDKASAAPGAGEQQPTTEEAPQEQEASPQETNPEEPSPETQAKEEAGAGEGEGGESTKTEEGGATDEAKEEGGTQQVTEDEGGQGVTESEENKEEGKEETTAETPGDTSESKQEEGGPTEGGEA